MMQKLWQDLRCGARGLFKRPGFSFIAVITFSLGIGATAAIFSVNNAGGLSKAVAAGALLSRLLISLKEQTAAAVARGETLEQTRKNVDLTEFRRLLAGDSTLRRILFGDYVSGAGVAAAFREATVKQ
jgi:hypothetical protein